MTPDRKQRSVIKLLCRGRPILDRIPADKASTLVEVGVNKAELGEWLLTQRPLLVWHGVDPWWGAENNSKAYKWTGDGHAMQTAIASQACLAEARVRVMPFGKRAVLIRQASPAAAGIFDDGILDAVFLDAAHDRESVAADIAAWWPKIKPGGWLGGDDYAHPDPRFRFGVKEAVDEFVALEGLALELEPARFDGNEQPFLIGKTWFVRKGGVQYSGQVKLVLREKCHGTGYEAQACPRCQGEGWLPPIDPVRFDGSYITARRCPACDGVGRV